MSGVGIFIDNSNLWIEGKKSYATKQGLMATECPHWRLKMGAVVETLVANRTILPNGGHLYGSTPPPTPELWAHFSKVIEVTLYPRSYHTNKEKCIDVELAASVTEFACDNPAATIILVTGDRDFVPVVKKLKKRNVAVEVWGWRRAFSQELVRFDYDHLVICYLDDIIDDIGFTKSEWNLSLEDIPCENALVYQSYAAHATEISEQLAFFNLPFHHFEVDNRDMVIIFNCGLGEKELFDYVQRGAEYGAIPLVTWKQRRNADKVHCKLALSFFNNFSALADEDSDEESGERAAPNIRLDEESMEEWTRVGNEREEGGSDRIFEICFWGKYCAEYTSGNCKFLHTKGVHEYFNICHNAKTLSRFKECTKEECHGVKGNFRCRFWHKTLNEGRLCPTCDQVSVNQHEFGQCHIILNFKKRKELRQQQG